MEKFKTVQDSETIFTELMVPTYANFGNKVHGGIILSIMDKVAYTTALKHCESYVVTVGVDGVEFLEPVELGNLLTMKARVNYVGDTSMIVGIRVESTKIPSGEVVHTNTAYFTMAVKNKEIKPPGLILQNSEDLRRFAEGLYLKKLGAEKRKTLKGNYGDKSNNELIEAIGNERMKVNLLD
jgi:acyl-CoA hydrolase